MNGNFSASYTVRHIILFTIFLVFVLVKHADAKEVYSFGIVPQQSVSKLARIWGPIFKYLENETGYKIRFSTAKTIPVFEKALAEGKYDFAYMNPYHYVVYHKHSGYKAFAKAKDKKIRGILVVHKDSKIKSISELNNKVLAFPSPLAFAASLLPRTELSKQNIYITPRYVSSHDSVYQNIAAKNFVAGGGVIRTFKAVAPEVSSQLRILYKTPGYTPHAFAYHPRVSSAVKNSLARVMRNMDKTPEGKKLLNTLKIKGISSAKDRDWNDVKKIRF